MAVSTTSPQINLAAEARTATLLVSEIYRSIQGESSFAGRPCVFVRLTGCPLRCVWCDTEYAFRGGDRFSLDEILRRVAELDSPLVEVTGGEPLAQPDCPALLTRLCDAGHETLLETSGAIDVSSVDPRVIKIVDVKCPGSGESAANRWENLSILGPRDELKFVIADRTDYEWGKRILGEYELIGTRPIHFSPAEGLVPAAELAEWLMADRLDVCLQVQLHKLIWPDRCQGV